MIWVDSVTADIRDIAVHRNFTHFYIGLPDFTDPIHTLTLETTNL